MSLGAPLLGNWLPPQLWDRFLGELPILAIFLGIGIWLVRRITKEHERHLKCKDDEIERLVQERNWLQKKLYGDRLSTEPVLDESPQTNGEEEAAHLPEPVAFARAPG